VVTDFNSYHLGEISTGAEFSASYSGFSDVQVAYTHFVEEALGMCFKFALIVGYMISHLISP